MTRVNQVKKRGKRFVMGILLMASAAFLTSCTTTGRYNTQKGALAGAGIGAIAGQLIGGNTASTMIGAGSGALIGAVVGNAQDQANQEAIDRSQEIGSTQAGQVVYDAESPPGRWTTVPGRWNGPHWVPEHRKWVPVNP
jgi:hypothetical protein